MTNTQQETEAEQPDEKSALPELNQVNLAGRLVNAPRVKDYGEDKKRAQFTLAVTRASRSSGGKQGVHTDYIGVVAWRALAKQCEGLIKGAVVQVQGRIRTWRDKTERYHWEIEADTLQVLDRVPPGSEDTAPKQREPSSA